MRVEVYRNLHRRCLSVRDARTRKVVAHVESVLLADARFVVSEAGRQRVLRERRKNVHAVVRGTLLAQGTPAPEGWAAVTYNPYRAATFVHRHDGTPCLEAPQAFVATSGALVPEDWSRYAEEHSELAAGQRDE